jgi:hypothetical protein
MAYVARFAIVHPPSARGVAVLRCLGLLVEKISHFGI